jgi:hypothetical protein
LELVLQQVALELLELHRVNEQQVVFALVQRVPELQVLQEQKVKMV